MERGKIKFFGQFWFNQAIFAAKDMQTRDFKRMHGLSIVGLSHIHKTLFEHLGFNLSHFLIAVHKKGTLFFIQKMTLSLKFKEQFDSTKILSFIKQV